MDKVKSDILKFLGSKDPLVILKKWLNESKKIPKLEEPWAMCLSTVNSKQKSRSRIVLLKSLEKDNLIFFTNYLSPKGQDLKNNPFASVVFFWPALGKQIRISGPVKKTRRKKSISYWKKRTRDSQLSQYISQQSESVKNRTTLEQMKTSVAKDFKDKLIPCPQQWGGYQLTIKEIEFWKNRKYRLHDRFLFRKKFKGWSYKRLFP